MENNYNYTPLTLLFSPNCLKCAIVNLKYAKNAPLGQSFCLPHPWGFLQGAMHAAWASGVLARGEEDDTPSSVGQGQWTFQADGVLWSLVMQCLALLSLFRLLGILLLGRSKVNGRIQRAGWMVLV